MSKSLMKKLFVGLLGVVGIVAIFMVATGEEESEDEIIGGPPGIVIDTGYNATLSGTPFYTVLSEDEDLYNDSLLTCKELGDESDRQQGWYSLVALEDGKTAKEVVFEQANLQEGDNLLAVYYNSVSKTFEAMPNRIIKDSNGSDLPLLDWNKIMKKGEVIVVNSNRSVDFCKDYKEAIDHEEVTVGSWNLVSKPDFDKVGYRSIWSVDFSGQNLNQFYSEDLASFDTGTLSEDDLFWVYGGNLVEDSIVDDSDMDDSKGDDSNNGVTDENDGNTDDTTDDSDTDDTDDTTDDSNNDLGGVNTGSLLDPVTAVINQPDVIITKPGFGGINFGDFITTVPVMSVDDVFSVSGTGTIVTGPVVSGTVKENEKVTLQCGNYRGEFTPADVRGENNSNEGEVGDEIAIVLPSSVKDEINCDLAVGAALKLDDATINYDEDIVLYASKNVNRNDQTILLQFGGRADQRDYVVFWEPDAGNARTIRIRARDNINDTWAGCSQIRVSVNGMTFQDGSSVDDENFDVTVNDNGKCGDETDISFAGKTKVQEFPNDSDSFYGTAEAVYYDEIGRGFWALNNNGEIFENFSQNDGQWRRLPGLSSINTPKCVAPADGTTSNCINDFVKETDQFYVMDSEENGRRYSLISWVGKDNRFYTYEYTGTNIIDGFVRRVDKFGTGVRDTVASKYTNSSTGELEDVVYVAYGCETTLTDTVGFNADPKRFVKCDVQMMTEFGDKVGILGNDFLMQGDRYFASIDNIWAINSFNGWTERFNVVTNDYKQITTSENANRSSVQELFFNNGNAYGINSQRRLFAWNDTADAWKEVDHNYTNGTTKLADVEYVGGGMVYADWGANDKVLFQVICESVAGTGDPIDPIMEVGCTRPGEYGSAIRLDSSKALGVTRFEEHVVFTFEGSERNLYRIKDKDSGSRAGVLSTRIEGFSTGGIKQVISAGDRIFVLFESGGDRYLINPDVDIKAL